MVVFGICAFGQANTAPQPEKPSGKRTGKANKNEKAQAEPVKEQQPDAAKAATTESGDGDQGRSQGPVARAHVAARSDHSVAGVCWQ